MQYTAIFHENTVLEVLQYGQVIVQKGSRQINTLKKSEWRSVKYIAEWIKTLK